MKKNLLRFVGFIILFSLIFAYLQPIFIRTHNGGVMVAQFYNEPINSFDVLIVGASGIRSSMLPPVMWDEAGISSYNFALSGGISPGQYYLLKEALRVQTPSVVLVMANYVFAGVNFDNDVGFRDAMDHMRLSATKLGSIAEIVSRSENQRFIDYLFPFLRYHDRDDWSKADFDLSFKKRRNLYMASWRSEETTFHEVERPEQLGEGEVTIGGEYLTKIIELCNENGIDVVIVDSPSCRDARWNTARYEALEEYAALHGAALINFNTEELWNEVGLDVSRDFFDNNHTNVLGGNKASRYVARYLAETYDFPDRREGPYDPHWDDVLEFYHTRLARLYAKFPDSGIEAGDEVDFDFNIEGLDIDD